MKTTAGPAVVSALGEDVDRLLSAEPEVREDLPDSVHQMRVATRRLRSVLRSYRDTFRRGPIVEIRDELRWLASILGTARDAEVRAERFEAQLDEQSEEQRRAARLLADAERGRYAEAHRLVLQALDGKRYARLRDSLQRLRSHPPLRRKQADNQATKVFAATLGTDYGQLRQLVRAEARCDDDRVTQLHDIRKAAKRLRYSSEAAVRVLDGPAEELARRAKKLQTVLGDHRDAVEAMATIHAQAEATQATGADATGYDRLYQAESDAARKALDQYPAAATFLRRKNFH